MTALLLSLFRYKRKAQIDLNILIVFLFTAVLSIGQTPTDALMMPPKNICILLSYDYGHFDRYWEGDNLRSNETIASVNRTTILPMAAVGIFDDLNFYIGLPYVKTKSSEPNGGKFEGANDFQDFMVALKYKALEKSVGSGRLSLLTTVGYSTPATNYLSDYMPYSLGFGAPEFSLRGIAQYQLSNGFYVRGMASHLWRGYTEAERDYYYNNGSFYTSLMDVPNAWNFEGVLGKWFMNNALKLELNYTGLKSTSGDNIRAYNAAQPSNKVKFDRLGISLQYYPPSLNGLGVVGYYTNVVNGLNTAKISNVGLGLTYQFNFIKNTNNEQNAQ
ncbi:transporter [uncultured Maribacter sp.]|uniref:transporter n=1 Tax=uncultured Maribacter sp. TaxID=431308 RepID=UPI0030D82CF8|tara:strand:+ start:2287 stop:3279 length:993 start_codon:yes stop_codon:yes gene_type:complete